MALSYPQLVAGCLQGFPLDPNLQLMLNLPFYNEALLRHNTSASTSEIESNGLLEPKKEQCDSSGSSPSPALSRNSSSSPEIDSGIGPIRVKRGRPQQDIQDDDDPSSQKRKHRRLYARQYRAQMRQRVDEVKSLKSEAEELRRLLKEKEAESKRLKEELAQKNFFISNLQCVLQSRIF